MPPLRQQILHLENKTNGFIFICCMCRSVSVKCVPECLGTNDEVIREITKMCVEIKDFIQDIIKCSKMRFFFFFFFYYLFANDI